MEQKCVLGFVHCKCVQFKPVLICQEATQAVQTLAEVAASQQEVTPVTQVNPVSVDMTDGQTTMQAFTTATFGQNGQIILSGEGALAGLQGTSVLFCQK